MFNYIDRQVLAAVEPWIRATFFSATDVNAMAISGTLGSAFLITYMLSAPVLGWLSDRFSRWLIIGCGSDPLESRHGGVGVGGYFCHAFCDPRTGRHW